VGCSDGPRGLRGKERPNGLVASRAEKKGNGPRGEKAGWATLVLGQRREKKRGGKGKWAGEEKERGWLGWAEREKRKRGERGLGFLFFSNSFSNFLQTSLKQ
jgi:hypothetical protein